jgi:hypothetical protein
MKGNLVIMNNLYRKVAVTSVCTALTFSVGVNKEAKAATFSFQPVSVYTITAEDNYREIGSSTTSPTTSFFITRERVYTGGFFPTDRETRAFYEFNLLNLFLKPNTIISQAILKNYGVASKHNDFNLGIFAYDANGLPDKSLNFDNRQFSFSNSFFRNYQETTESGGGSRVNFDVTNAINYSYPFVGFGIYNRNNVSFNIPGFSRNGVVLYSSPTLEITTVDVAEPVPEPTTIFGSALALAVGGWLKRKKSNSQNKTTAQH